MRGWVGGREEESLTRRQGATLPDWSCEDQSRGVTVAPGDERRARMPAQVKAGKDEARWVEP